MCTMLGLCLLFRLDNLKKRYTHANLYFSSHVYFLIITSHPVTWVAWYGRYTRPAIGRYVTRARVPGGRGVIMP